MVTRTQTIIPIYVFFFVPVQFNLTNLCLKQTADSFIALNVCDKDSLILYKCTREIMVSHLHWKLQIVLETKLLLEVEISFGFFKHFVFALLCLTKNSFPFFQAFRICTFIFNLEFLLVFSSTPYLHFYFYRRTIEELEHILF